MDIEYEIVSFFPETGSMLVRYFCEEAPDGIAYNIDIPIENHTYPPKEDIVKLIEVMKPAWQLTRSTQLKGAVPPSWLMEFATTTKESGYGV